MEPERKPYSSKNGRSREGLTGGKYHCYEVVKPTRVKKGITLPWFGEVDGGVQYETEKPIYMLSSLKLKKDVTEDE